MKKNIYTDQAPAPVGTYSQAIAANQTIYLAGQIPLDPETSKLVDGDFRLQTEQVFKNIRAVCQAAGGTLNDIVKLTVYVTDLTKLPIVNEVMPHYFAKAYPARTAIGISALPLGALIEVEAVMVLAQKE